MQIVSLTWARNEEDIIEAFVRHHMNIVDHMIVVLHRSQDRSQEILEALQKEGLSLEIREDDGVAHRQSDVLTALMHEVVHRYKFDWILPIDADEFIVCDKGNPRAVLESIEQGTVIQMPWKTYVPYVDDHQDDANPLTRITHRRDHEPKQFYKIAIPISVITNNCHIPEGNHIVMHSDKALDAVQHPHLFVAHFPVRSQQQLRQKIIQGWESHLANPSRTDGQAFHWRDLYDRCKDPVSISADELTQIALHYATTEKTIIQLLYDPILVK